MTLSFYHIVETLYFWVKFTWVPPNLVDLIP